MRKALCILIIGILFYQCSNLDKTIKQTESTIDIDPSQFIIHEIESDSNNIVLLNKILSDTKYQLPYIDNSFYKVEDLLEGLDISKTEYASIISQARKENKNFRFKPGSFTYYDTSSHKIRESILIRTEEESYNKELIKISRPYKLNKKEVIVFFFETFLYYRNNQPRPIVGNIGAVRFRNENGKWVQKKYYCIADLS